MTLCPEILDLAEFSFHRKSPGPYDPFRIMFIFRHMIYKYMNPSGWSEVDCVYILTSFQAPARNGHVMPRIK